MLCYEPRLPFSPSVKTRSMLVEPGLLNGTPAQTMARSPSLA